MIDTAGVFEKTDTFQTLRWRESLAPWVNQATQPFVTISRQSGSGGTTLARILARQLNITAPRDVFWQIFEGTLAPTMLKENCLPPRIARFLPEDHVSEVRASLGELVGLHPSLWDLVRKMNSTMQKLAQSGHAILVGRGANFATADIPGGFHVRLVAPPAHRARYTTQVYGVSEAAALTFNAKRDAARRRYVKDNFNANIDDPAAYDLTINTATMPLAEAAKLIIANIQARVAASA